MCVSLDATQCAEHIQNARRIMQLFPNDYFAEGSALRWLRTYVPSSRITKVVVPEEYRMPKFNVHGIDKGYYKLFSQLGFTQRDSDLKTAHYHYWVMDPQILTQIIQPAIYLELCDRNLLKVAANDTEQLTDFLSQPSLSISLPDNEYPSFLGCPLSPLSSTVNTPESLNSSPFDYTPESFESSLNLVDQPVDVKETKQNQTQTTGDLLSLVLNQAYNFSLAAPGSSADSIFKSVILNTEALRTALLDPQMSAAFHRSSSRPEVIAMKQTLQMNLTTAQVTFDIFKLIFNCN